jgi:hypothetical protein
MWPATCPSATIVLCVICDEFKILSQWASKATLVLWVFTDECCHPNRFRVELMLIESFEIGRLDFPNRDTLESTHCFLPNETHDQRLRMLSEFAPALG